MRGAREILDREHRAKGLLKARDISRLGIGAQKLLVAFALDLDQVRHFADLVDIPENLADAALLVGAGRGRHVFRFGRHDIPYAPGARRGTRSQVECRARLLGAPCHTCGPLRSFGPCPGKDRKGPGRTSSCGGAVMCWMKWI